MAINENTDECWCNLCGAPIVENEDSSYYQDVDYAGQDFTLCENCLSVILIS